jgi:hypothetical protein
VPAGNSGIKVVGRKVLFFIAVHFFLFDRMTVF